MITNTGHILTPSLDYDIRATARWFRNKALSFLRRRLALQASKRH